MSFECAVFADGYRCPNDDAGDTTYLKGLTFCREHQDAFEELVQSKVLLQQVVSAKMSRFLGPILAGPHPTAPAPRQDLRQPASVYFFRCGNFVKIGFSVSPHMRLRQIQYGDGTKFPSEIDCRLASLIATESGGSAREKELHAKFAHLRHTGEWFTEAPELTEYIESLSEGAA